jgi:opacity protein-like surface antigen
MPSATQTFKLTAAQFAAAKAKAVSICQTKPEYNLFGLQCTAFVRQVLAAAGKAPALGFGLIFDSPNALHSWIKSNALIIGASLTAATSAPGGAGAGGFGLDISYTHQFYSVLGEKLRFHWLSRGELSSRQATVSTGIGAELTTQRVFLPSAYVFGGGIMGGMTPNFPGVQPEGFGAGMKFGAGLTSGIGLRYNVDEALTIGVEYNLVKDFVEKDPLLNRLVLRAGLKF